MPRNSVDSVLWDIRSFVAGVKAEGQSDHYLLQQFACQHDESAFAALLRRHGPMAMGVCIAVLRNKHLAEDAFQATFLVLAIKAGELCKRGFVAGWLYGVALPWLVSSRLNVSIAPAANGAQDVQPDTSMEVSEREEEELLDEELQRLAGQVPVAFVALLFRRLDARSSGRTTRLDGTR